MRNFDYRLPLLVARTNKWLQESNPADISTFFSHMLDQNKINFGMIRTLVEMAGVSKGYRDSLSPNEKAKYYNAVAVTNKDKFELQTWNTTVCYLFVKNARSVIYAYPPVLSDNRAVRCFRVIAYNPGIKDQIKDALLSALANLAREKAKASKAVYDVGPRAMATALGDLPTDTIHSLLNGITSPEFLKNVTQLAAGHYVSKAPDFVMHYQSVIEKEILESDTELEIASTKILAILSDMEDSRFLQSILDCNVIDFGHLMRSLDRKGEVMKKLSAVDEDVYKIALAAWNNKYKMNYDDKRAARRIGAYLIRQP